MIVPRISGRTITSTLMRDAVASIFRLHKREYADMLSIANIPKVAARYRQLFGKTPV